MTEQLTRIPVAAETKVHVAELGSLSTETLSLLPSTVAPANFRFGQLSSSVHLNPAVLASSPPDLGALSDFVGTWTGTGFNTIFRPNNTATPTELPSPVTGDNILELNLTQETLSFSPSLGSVPNRGSGGQGDAFLNGVPYLQSISDVTVAGQSVGIHAEPGLWMAVPPTTDPAEGRTYSRMASIPHGTTVVAQGTSHTFAGAPTIDPVDMTPFIVGSNPHALIPFPSQTATNLGTPRIPQDLTAWIAAGTITQEMLTDPNSVLRNQLAAQTVLETTAIAVSTAPDVPLFGGGTDNIAFLLGDAASSAPNANAVQMTAIFWIETIQLTVDVPVFPAGVTSLKVRAPQHLLNSQGDGERRVLLTPPFPITEPRTITFAIKQIQYTQTVFLNFAGLTWPHVSVGSLLPAGAIVPPPSAWA